MKTLTILVVSAFVLTPTSSMAAGSWNSASNKLCSRVCSNAVVAGTRGAQGAQYFVCAANAFKEGWRVGYNLNHPDFAGQCRVAYNGKEVPFNSYRCLCVNPGS